MSVAFHPLMTQQLSQVMDILTVQHRALAQNIANTNTPGYVRRTVDFNQELQKVLAGPVAGSPAAVSGQSSAQASILSEIEIIEDRSQTPRQDGNNVNLEQEMVGLAELAQMYGALARLTTKQISMARTVITGGRG